ncbi:MAG TPA: amino acid--[acyl-carrier-protein] ligase [Bryobacteraceae bacterium]|jgi:seryl-tRNA synthetase|nr:amino acid--[acyl-carrier-protein] ligase [Bryobacteraceae bacterium]
MTTAAPLSTESRFLDDLILHGHFLPTGEPGLYGRGMVFEDVRARFDALVTRIHAADRPETPRFPPLIPRRTLEQAGYLNSFPHLCGVVFSFEGGEPAALKLAERAKNGGDWTSLLSATGVALAPAACYPSYPAIAARGPLPPEGVTLDLGGCYVFRHEPSADPARLQMFHQRELVRIGAPDQVAAWRETWMNRARKIFAMAGLEAALAPASDQFFGRTGKLLANSQREQGLKFEALVSIASEQPTAAASFNLHHEHFGSAFGIRRHDGSVAHSSCVGFGLERITLALFRAHGMDPGKWPQSVRRNLWPE